MTNKLEQDATARPAASPAIVETIPSLQGGISALASAGAPFIVFDASPYAGFYDGLGEITLVARRRMGHTVDSAVATDYAVTAHLRGSLQAMRQLRDMIDDVILLAIPSPTEATS